MRANCGKNRRHLPGMLMLVVCFWAGLLQYGEARPSGAQSAEAHIPDVVAVLQLHNQYRAQHGAGPLTWSQAVATTAAKHARKCNWEHSTVQERNAYGENLYFSKGLDRLTLGSRATKTWYQEVKDYNWNAPGTAKTQGADIGHFTQMVWREGRALGCAYVRCPSLKNTPYTDVDFLVCQYDPPGNILGAFQANVLPAGTRALAAPSSTSQETAAMRQPTDAWLTTPPCSKKPTNGVNDNKGRLWGFENGRSCKYQPSATLGAAAAGNGGKSPASARPLRPARILLGDGWDAAPACTGKDSSKGVKDKQGRLWGWENGKSCAFKANTAVSNTTATTQGAPYVNADWDAAPECTSKIPSGVRDKDGRLWGSENGKPCAHREFVSSTTAEAGSGDMSGNATSTADKAPAATSVGEPVPGTDWWDIAPACKGPGTTKDRDGRMWGFEDGKSCAVKSGTAQAPAAPQDSGAATQAPDTAAGGPVPGSDWWDSAPPCKGAGTTKDRDGRMWGFEDGKSCAVKGSTAATAATASNTSETSSPSSSPSPAASPAPEAVANVTDAAVEEQKAEANITNTTAALEPPMAAEGPTVTEDSANNTAVVAADEGQTAEANITNTTAALEPPMAAEGPTVTEDSANNTAVVAADEGQTAEANVTNTTAALEPPMTAEGPTVTEVSANDTAVMSANTTSIAVANISAANNTSAADDAAIDSAGNTSAVTIEEPQAQTTTSEEAAATAAANKTAAAVADTNVTVTAAPGLQIESAPAKLDASTVEIWVNSWDFAPECEGQPGPDAIKDSLGRSWGFEDGKTCAYKG